MKKDFSKLSSSDSVKSAVKVMEKMNTDYLLIGEEGKIKGVATSRGLVGYPSSRLILDCPIEPVGTLSEEALLDEALKVLEKEKVSFLVILDREGIPIGVINREMIISFLYQELKETNERLAKAKEELEEFSKSLEKKVKERTFELSVLYEVSNAISYTLNYQQLLKLIMQSLYKIVDYDVCASFLFTEKKGNLVVKAVKPVTKDFVEGVQRDIIVAFGSLTGRAISEKDISVDLEAIPRPSKGEKPLTKVGSFFNIPLIVEGKAIGMLNVSSSRENAFKQENIKILYAISSQAASAIERLKGVIATEKSKMEAMVESMTEGLIIMDREGNPIICNPAAKRMLNLAPEEIDRKHLEECFKKTGLDLVYEEIIFGRKEVVTKDITITEPIKMDLRADIAPVKDMEEKTLGMVIVLQNITAEKEVDQMKTEFISTVSHELRTPLTTMKEFVSIVLDGIPGKINKDQKEYLSIVKGNIDRLARIIASLLDISRIEARRVELRKALVNIKDLAGGVVVALKSRADAKHIILKTSFPRAFSDVYVDPDRITQVFTNLIDNAIKFTPEKGRIAVELRARKKELECSVSDTGVGIAPEDRDRVFERFRQIGRTAGAGAKGTGLGLPIIKELVQMHNGRIWVESEVGKGSKFTFTIPRLKVDDIFREYLNNGLRAAKEKHAVLSLIVVDLANFNQIKKDYGLKGCRGILDELEAVVKNTVRRPTDLVSRYKKGRSVIVLGECDKQGAQALQGRIEKTIEKHEFKVGKAVAKVALTYGTATYPDEATNDVELINKASEKLKSEKARRHR